MNKPEVVAAGPNTGASVAAIAFHYSAGNEFYRLWLDQGLNYSAALYAPGDSFEQAQFRKLDYLFDQAKIEPGMAVLDIGCGWGAALRRLGTVRGARAVGLTINAEQAKWMAAQAMQNAEVRVEAWQDHAPPEPYDAIVSIEAFEHFTKAGQTHDGKVADYRAFFRKCHGLLKSGGRLSLQTNAYGNAAPDLSGFIARKIFPESDFPTLAEMAEASDGLFEMTAMRNDRDDYLRTLREWLQRLRHNRAAAIALVGTETVQRYEAYIGMSVIGFHTGQMALLRLSFRRNDRPYKP